MNGPLRVLQIFLKTLTFKVLYLGAIHKRRLLRGVGRGSPLKADLVHKPI